MNKTFITAIFDLMLTQSHLQMKFIPRAYESTLCAAALKEEKEADTG